MPKFFTSNSRPLADPENAALRLMEHARAFEPPQHGWIDIEQLKHPFLFADKAAASEYRAGVEHAIAKGWLELHESKTFVKFTRTGAELFSGGTKPPPDA
jgi:hypothetical protein